MLCFFFCIREGERERERNNNSIYLLSHIEEFITFCFPRQWTRHS